MGWISWGSVLLLSAASGPLLADESCDRALAERVFSRCAICHSTRPDTGHGVGPNLHAIVGREIASHEDFFYSEALAGIDGTWTEDSLGAFLANPAAFAPGTTMGFGGLASAGERSAVICHLAAESGDQ